TNDPVIVGPWLRASFFLLFIAYILAIYALLRNYLPLKYAFLGTLICLLNLHTYFLSDLCFPEIPFGLATVLFFICDRHEGRGTFPSLAAVLAVVSYAFRTIGI